jgi:hypothetical protein
VTGTSDLLTKFYTKEVGCIHEKSTANWVVTQERKFPPCATASAQSINRRGQHVTKEDHVDTRNF